MATTGTTTADLPQVTVDKNDNSNPQQGSRPRTPSPSKQPPSQEAQPNTTEASMGMGDVNRVKETPRTFPVKKDGRKLFVGGLPSDVTEAEFQEFFGQFGEIQDFVVMFDRETHRSRGFGFVTYGDVEVASRLLNMNQDGEGRNGNTNSERQQGDEEGRVGRLVMRGKTCEVKAAEPKEASRANRRGYQTQGARRFLAQKIPAPGGRHIQHTQAGFPPQAAGLYDPHYVAAAAAAAGGHQYPMYAPGYYPAYQHHHGMYAGGGHAPAAMYGPMPQAVPAPVDSQQLYGPPMISPMESSPGMYMDHDAGYDVHPHMMYPVYPEHQQNTPAMNGYPAAAPGTPSAMQPVTPGLPTKEENT